MHYISGSGLLLLGIPLEAHRKATLPQSLLFLCLTMNVVNQVRKIRNVTELKNGLFVDIWFCLPPNKVMSIEEVERIMDETQDAVEYQQVRCQLSVLN